MKINRNVLAEHTGIKPLSVSQWFTNTGRSIKNVDDITDFVMYQRIKNLNPNKNENNPRTNSELDRQD